MPVGAVVALRAKVDAAQGHVVLRRRPMVTGSICTGRRVCAPVGEDRPVTQHGYPSQHPGQHGGQPQPAQPQYGQSAPSQYAQPQYAQPQYAQPQRVQQYAQPQYGQPQPAQQYAQPQPGQQQYGQPPSSGYGVPSSAPGYGQHVARPQAGGFAAQQQPVAPNGQELADVWTRLLARLIDGLIVGGLVSIVVVPLVLVVFFVSISASDGEATLVGVLLITELLAFLLALAGQYVYDVEFAKRTGQTIGKRVMKLRIVPLDPHLPLDRGVLARRWLVSSPGGLIPGLGLFNVLWCLWDQPYRQCLHDKFAKTVVVKVPA